MVIRLIRENVELTIVERTALASRVYLAVKILTEQIEPIFNKRPNNYAGANFHTKPENRNYRILLGITNYLLDLRGEYGNSLSNLLLDYYSSIYSYYKRINRSPYLVQLSPSDNNRFGFETWIQNWENYFGETYWVEKDRFENVVNNAKKIANEIKCAEFGIITVEDAAILVL